LLPCYVGEEFLTDTKKGLFWPVIEPVQCAAIDKGREFPATDSERISHR